jgi:hypothetical protein
LSGSSVRFFPVVTGNTYPITEYKWWFGDQYTFTTDFATNNTRLLFSDASTYFVVDDRVMLTTSDTLPNGLSTTTLYFIKAVTSTYVTVSTTSGGAAVTFSDNGTGTHKIEHGSLVATPIIEYPSVASLTKYDVKLTVTDSNSGTATHTETDYIVIDITGHVAAMPTDGTYQRISVFVYDDTNSMMVNRTATSICNLLLMNPVIVNTIDKSTEATFSILDIGNSTATEKLLISEGKNVIAIQNKFIIFSGAIRRVSRNTQGAFAATDKIQIWDVECDSDLLKLAGMNVDSTALVASGAKVNDTPGNIARRILTPGAGEWDWRGNICCNDTKVSFQLNSANIEEQVPSRYELITALRTLTNYDLITRYEFEVHEYSIYDSGGSPASITCPGASFTSALEGKRYFVVSDVYLPDYPDYYSGTAADTEDHIDINPAVLPNDLNLGDRIIFSANAPGGTSLGTYYYVVYTDQDPVNPLIKISATEGGTAITFSSSTSPDFYKAEPTRGIVAYGTIDTVNSGTELYIDDIVEVSNPLTVYGYILIEKGPLLDFAKDLSTPSSVASYEVNNDLYSYNDNDDKRKFYSKVIAKGKDLRGVTISVALSGCHAYDEDNQYYNDSTHVTLKTEGMVYSNAYYKRKTAVTVYVDTHRDYTTNYAAAPNDIMVTNADTYFQYGSIVKFPNTGWVIPAPLVYGTEYYVVFVDSTHIHISATYGGTAITLTSDGSGTKEVEISYNWIDFDNSNGTVMENDTVTFLATSYPTPTNYLMVYYAVNVCAHGCRLKVHAGAPYLFTIINAGSAVYIINLNDIPVYGAGSTSEFITLPLYLYGWGYTIPSGTVLTLTLPYSTTYENVTTGGTTETVLGNNTKVTLVTITSFPTNDFSNGGHCLSAKIFVNDKSLYTSGTVEMLFGEEIIDVTGSGTDTTYGDYFTFTATGRIMSATEKHYPHGIGCLVAKTNCTEAAPETGSPIDAYGLYIDSETVDGNITYGDLDAYATALLLGFGAFYKKATCTAPLYRTGVKRVGTILMADGDLHGYFTPPRIGDTVSVTQFDGDIPEDFEVIAVTIKYDEGSISLGLGDYEKNIFTSLRQETNAINRTMT